MTIKDSQIMTFRDLVSLQNKEYARMRPKPHVERWAEKEPARSKLEAKRQIKYVECSVMADDLEFDLKASIGETFEESYAVLTERIKMQINKLRGKQ